MQLQVVQDLLSICMSFKCNEYVVQCSAVLCISMNVLTLRMICNPRVFAGQDLSPAENGKKFKEPSVCPKPVYASSLFFVLSNLAILSG